MVVEAGILHISTPPSHMHRKQPHRSTQGGRALVFRHDDHGRRADDHPGILVGRAANAACDHETEVHVVGHVVGVEGLADGIEHPLTGHADVDHQGRSTLEEAVKVLADEGDTPAAHPETLPDGVAHQESAVEHRYTGLISRDKLAVEVDEHALVAGVGLEAV